VTSDLDFIFSEVENPQQMVIWDLGRRCNYDCTYCTAWMHSTTSPFNKFEQFKKTADFIDEYYSIYRQHHKNPKWRLKISFTGGEPAINPGFFKLVPYLKENYPYMYLNLTTNGAWSERRGQFLLDNMHSMTVSYHAEGTQEQKELVKRNLKFVQDRIGDKWWRLKVNVMMHEKHFDECVDLIENFLKPNGIRYTPRVIGDDGMYKDQWFKDDDGQMRKTTHNYSTDQLNYLRNHWNTKNKEVDKNAPKLSSRNSNTGHGRDMGRMCCGGRCMTIKQPGHNVRDAMFIEQSNFKGYNCMINWFFLHIEEDRDAVYHHQTCMGRLEGSPIPEMSPDLVAKYGHMFRPEKGPICSISKSRSYLDWLKAEFDKGRTPIMKCPNTHCGCGICIPKAKEDQVMKNIAERYIKVGNVLS
jgi:MoaA/NifB/PqqE/SkfB family radical SAM enzyme